MQETVVKVKPRYSYSSAKGTRISVLESAKIGINIRDIRRSVKLEEKKVLFLSEKSRKLKKRGHFFYVHLPVLVSEGKFIFF